MADIAEARTPQKTMPSPGRTAQTAPVSPSALTSLAEG